MELLTSSSPHTVPTAKLGPQPFTSNFFTASKTMTTAASQAHSPATSRRQVLATNSSFVFQGFLYQRDLWVTYAPLIHSQEKIIHLTQSLRLFFRILNISKVVCAVKLFQSCMHTPSALHRDAQPTCLGGKCLVMSKPFGCCNTYNCTLQKAAATAVLGLGWSAGLSSTISTGRYKLSLNQLHVV